MLSPHRNGESPVIDSNEFPERAQTWGEAEEAGQKGCPMDFAELAKSSVKRGKKELFVVVTSQLPVLGC
jgi:hypothetical protein